MGTQRRSNWVCQVGSEAWRHEKLPRTVVNQRSTELSWMFRQGWEGGPERRSGIAWARALRRAASLEQIVKSGVGMLPGWWLRGTWRNIGLTVVSSYIGLRCTIL